MSHNTTLAACYWSPYLALVVMNEGRIIAVQRVRASSQALEPILQARLQRMTTAHRVRHILVEPKLLRYAWDLFPDVESRSVVDAKHDLHLGHCSHDHLLRQLVEQHPPLRRFVTRRKTGHQTFKEPWRNVALLGIALAMSAEPTTH
jgi:hypothetical protein